VSALAGNSIAIGINATAAADCHLGVRRPQTGWKGAMGDEFVSTPSLAGMNALTKRLAQAANHA